MDHYERSKIVFSLRTKSCRAAKIKAASLASQLEEDWLTLRWRSKDTPLLRFLKGQAAEARISSSAPLMTAAGTIYLRVKGASRPIIFSADVSEHLIAQLLGHSNSSITMSRYGKEYEVDKLFKAVEKLNLHRVSL